MMRALRISALVLLLGSLLLLGGRPYKNTGESNAEHLFGKLLASWDRGVEGLQYKAPYRWFFRPPKSFIDFEF